MDTTMRDRRDQFGAWHRAYPWLRFPAAFLIHQFLSTWGLFIAVPWVLIFFLELGLHFGLRVYMAQIEWVLYGTPLLPLHVVLALMTGWVLGGTLRERSMLWVWVLPFVSLCTSHMGFPLLGRGDSADYTFLAYSGKLVYAWGRFGLHSLGEIIRLCLLYTAVAYSLGALLAFRAVRAPTFFENVRQLRKMRLILLVGLPWFCLRFLLSWQSVRARYPVVRSSTGLHYYLQGLFIMSVFVAFVFAIAVAVVGRRFAVTRFFLRPSGG
jgi:hypothetical protein